MENRTLWIVVAVLVVLTVLCCCVVAGAAGIATYFTAVPTVSEGGIGRAEERVEQTFIAGEAPSLEVDNFAGSITVAAGESGRMQVVLTKKAGNAVQLERIGVEAFETENGAVIRTSGPATGGGYRAVEIEITVPPDAQLSLATEAGHVEVVDVLGRIDAHSGAGAVEARGAKGPVALDTGAGSVEYSGDPRGECIFETGAGSVTVRLPADVDARIELSTGVGRIDVGAFDVDGRTSATEVEGTIGTGEGASIKAQTAAGRIRLVER